MFILLFVLLFISLKLTFVTVCGMCEMRCLDHCFNEINIFNTFVKGLCFVLRQVIVGQFKRIEGRVTHIMPKKLIF